MILTPLAAAAAIGFSAVGVSVDIHSARDRMLATPAPYPTHRVDSPDRVENGRLWVSRFPVGSRFPIAEQVGPQPGPAHYGAAPEEMYRVIYARVLHLPVAINPWERMDRFGLAHLERSRNQWLREQGYILSVRTHVNALYSRDAAMYRSVELPTPRATIHIEDDVPRRPSRQRVAAPADALPVVRVSTPQWSARPLPPMVIEPAPRDPASALAEARND